MKRFFLVFLIAIISEAQVFSQSLNWAQGISESSGIGPMDFDSDNNIYSVGGFKGTTDFDPGSGVYNLTAVGNVKGDMFVRKQDSSGNLIWVKQISTITAGAQGCTVKSIHLDGRGFVYVSGFFIDSVDFDPGPDVYKLNTYGGFHSFILKLNPDGNFVWVKDMGNFSTIGIMQLRAVAFDKMDNIYFAASIGGTAIPVSIDVDPGPAIYDITSMATSGNDFIIEKLDSAGNFVWVKQITGKYDKDAVAMALDSNQNIYISGGFSDTVDFDPGPGVGKLYSGNSNGGSAGFVAKYDSSFNFIWVKQIGVAGNYPLVWGLAVDIESNVLVTGKFSSLMDFDPGTGVYNLLANSTANFFTLKLRSNGDFAWARIPGNIGGTNSGRAIITDLEGNVYTAVYIPGGCDLDPDTSYCIVIGSVAVQKLDSAGKFVWAVGWQGDIPGWIGLDYSNHIYVTGDFSGLNKDFDPGIGTFLLSGSVNGSGFIEKLNQDKPSEINEVNHISELYVFPNPTKNKITFNSSLNINNIVIFDNLGREIITISPMNTKTTLILEDCLPGVYFYKANLSGRIINGNIILSNN